MCIFLISGNVSLIKSSESGENRVVFLLNDGSMINEPLMRKNTSGIECWGFEDSKILRIGLKTFDKIMSKDYILAKNCMVKKWKKNKEILIRRGNTVSYDSDKLYRNNIEVPKIEEDQRSSEERAKAEKQTFYDAFFRQPFKYVVILAAAGTSLNNGSKRKGKTREGLWDEGLKSINDLCDILWRNETEKSQRIKDDKDIESLLSHVLLVEKIDEAKATRLKPFREDLERIIREECRLTLDVNAAPHKTFLDKITARKASEPRVQLFTTNYDTLFEQAAQEGGYAVIDGFSFTFPRTFSGRYFDYDIVQRERTRLKNEESFRV